MNADNFEELADAEFLASLEPEPKVGYDPVLEPEAFIKWVNDYASAQAEEYRQTLRFRNRHRCIAKKFPSPREES